MNDMFNHTDNEKKYADIFKLTRPKSKGYPKISIEERAAQFSSFEALVGLDDELDETARTTDQALELSEDQKMDIEEKIRILNDCAVAEPIVKVTYFVSDEKKTGGMYVCMTGKFKCFDEQNKCIVINERSNIQIDTVVDIDSTLFI